MSYLSRNLDKDCLQDEAITSHTTNLLGFESCAGSSCLTVSSLFSAAVAPSRLWPIGPPNCSFNAMEMVCTFDASCYTTIELI